MQYEREKSKISKNQYTSAEAQNELQQTTAEKLAKQHKVEKSTIKRDAQFSRAVDNVAKAAGNGAKTALLSRDTKVTKQDAVKLGAIAQSNPQTVKNVLELVLDASPKVTSQIIREVLS